ncbi:MAG: hypothetical protein ACTSVZ_13065 [Promethearchaeota archaeon]
MGKSGKRLAGIDSAKGFGIFIMILVHLFTQQIARGDSTLFVPVVSGLNPLMFIILAPLIVMGVWGSIFTLMTCILISKQMFQIQDRYQNDPSRKKHLGKYFLGRIWISVILMLVYRGFRMIFGIVNPECRYRIVYGLNLIFSSDTIDSIVFVGTLIPLVLLVVFKFPLLQTPRGLTVFFFLLGATTLGLSSFFIPWGRDLCALLESRNLYFLELILSKFVYGRFKIAHTFSFGCLGAIFGYWLHRDIPRKKLMIYLFSFVAFCFLYLGIFLLIDWTIVLQYANVDIPIAIQVFNFGGQLIILAVCIGKLDYGSTTSKKRAGRRSIWLRRYGIISLTVFTIGTLLGEGIFWIFEKVIGPSIGFSGSNQEPYLAWSTLQISFLLISVVLAWEIILRLWEKIRYIPGIEWMITTLSVVFRFKKSNSLHIEERLYYYRTLTEDEPLKENPPLIEVRKAP